MNKGGLSSRRPRGGKASGTRRRTYDNRLREQQAEATRERILSALCEVLADESLTELSVAKVAERAEVSEPTVYRYFPNREALQRGFDEHWVRRLPRPDVPSSLDDVPGLAVESFLHFDRDRAMIRATVNAAAVGEFARVGHERRTKALRQLLAPKLDHLSPAQAEARFAVVRLLYSSLAWKTIEDRFGVTGEQSGRAVAWALRALIAELGRERGEEP